MKKCLFCGNQNFDVSVVCERCKKPLATSPFARVSPSEDETMQTWESREGEEQSLASGSKKRSTRVVAHVFMIIATIQFWMVFLFSLINWIVSIVSSSGNLIILTCYGVMFVLLIYSVIVTCMTVAHANRLTAKEYVGVGFKICTLLFVNTIVGILMLCDNE